MKRFLNSFTFLSQKEHNSLLYCTHKREGNEEISKENKKTIHKLKKFNKKLDNFIKALLICYAIFLTLLIIGGTIFYIMYLNDIKERVNIDAIADLKNTYGIKTKVISQDLDKYENGKYELKSNEDDPIEF